MRLKLVGTDSAQSFELREGPPLVVGRAPNSDIPIFDPTISRRHAEIDCGAGFAIRDLGSSNGTYVNGERVTERALTPGDVLTFGKVSFRVMEAPEVPAPPPRPVPAHPTPDTGPRTGERPDYVLSGLPEEAPSGAKILADYHTHPRTEKFSDPDLFQSPRRYPDS